MEQHLTIGHNLIGYFQVFNPLHNVLSIIEEAYTVIVGILCELDPGQVLENGPGGD